MTIQERQEQLTRIIRIFLKIDSSLQEMLNKTIETISRCEDDWSLDLMQVSVIVTINEEMEKKATRDNPWHTLTVDEARASSSNFTELDQLEQDLNEFNSVFSRFRSWLFSKPETPSVTPLAEVVAKPPETDPESTNHAPANKKRTLRVIKVSRNSNSNDPAVAKPPQRTRKPEKSSEEAAQPFDASSESNIPVPARKKRTRRVPRAKNKSVEAEEIMPVLKQLSQLETEFQQLSDEKSKSDLDFLKLVKHCTENTISEDIIVEPLLKAFRANAEEARELIVSTKNELATAPTDNDARIKMLADVNQKLLILVKQKLYLNLGDLLHRVQLLTPFPVENENLEQITLAVQIIHAQLREKLQDFLDKFMLLKFDDETPPETQELLAPLIKFIDNLYNILKTGDLIIDARGVHQLYKSMKAHLKPGAAREALTVTMTTDIMRQMCIGNMPQTTSNFTSFTSLFSEREAAKMRINAVKKQFTSAHHAISTIESFGINHVKDHSMYIQAHDLNAIDINEKYNTHSLSIEDEKANLNRLKFLCFEHSTVSLNPTELQEYRDAQLFCNRLERIQKDLDKDYADFKLASCNLSEVDPIKRLEAITDLQGVQQKNLEIRAAQLLTLKVEISPFKNVLRERYRHNALQLKQKLKALNKDYDAALAAANMLPDVTIKSSITSCQANLSNNNYIPMNDSPPESLQSIPALRRACLEPETSLRENIQSCRDAVLKLFSERLEHLRTSDWRGTAPVSVSTVNIFIDDMKKNIKFAADKETALNDKIASLNTCSGNQLAQWKEDVNGLLSEAQFAIETRNSTYNNVKEMESRLKNPYYKLTSAKIIPAIEAEIVRISTKYRNDPRIAELQRMISSFRGLGDDYICRNLKTIDNGLEFIREGDHKDRYKARLQIAVRQLFHRSPDHDLETLSEHKRNAFLTWIRVHIIKPLQQLFGPTPRANRFFATKGATRYEHNIINMGNVALDDLEKSPDALERELDAEQENRRRSDLTRYG